MRSLPEPPSRRPAVPPNSADVATSTARSRVAQVVVDCGVYVDGVRLPGGYAHADALAKVREVEQTGRSAFVWLGLHEPDEHQMQDAAHVFGLHPLAVEDAVHAHQRPKLERYDETLFLVLKTVNYVPHESVELAREIVETGEIMVFIGKDFVVTVRHGGHGGLTDVRKRLDADREHMRLGPYAVMHAIADDVVDHYLEVAHLMEADIDDIQEAVFTERKTNPYPIYQIKHEVIALRRCVSPLSAAFQRMQSKDGDLIPTEVMAYLRDVADHHTQAADLIASYDEILSSLVQAALARLSVQQNLDMRKMSAWTAIVAVPTMVVGLFGIAFDHLPAQRLMWAYLMLFAAMTLLCLQMYRRFRRNDWL